MECQSSDSKKIFKVFEASKRKRAKKKKEGLDDTNSIATDDSTSGCQPNACHLLTSAKASLQNILTAQTIDVNKDGGDCKRDRDSSPSPIDTHRKRSSVDTHRASRSPRRHHRPTREGLSLALKARMMSTPRSISPQQESGAVMEIPQDQDSFIYAFLEEAIKKDKKKQRHSRRHEEYRRKSREREDSVTRKHRHRHRRRDDVPSRERDRTPKDISPAIDQNVLFETFAKLCAQLNEKSSHYANQMQRSQSHKSLQCEVVSRRDSYDVDQRPVRLQSHEHSRENVSRIRSHNDLNGRVRSHDKVPINSRPERVDKQDKCAYCSPYEKKSHYMSKLDLNNSRIRTVDDARYPEYPPRPLPTKSCVNQCYGPQLHEHRDYRDYEREPVRRRYEEDKRKYIDQKTSRSFEVHREGYVDDDKYYRRSARSENTKDKRYDHPRERRYDDRDKYYEDRYLDNRDRYHVGSRDRRSRRNLERFERTSLASRDEDYRERDRYSEKEKDSGLSVADGETSTVSGRSNYLRVVKQEIAEQREAMDKMMQLWKELMRCFKGISSQTSGQEKAVNDSAANVRESAAAQLRLWRECMRRYETVARDVGDTDARLMEEINKQRSEMAEMASMWQECLQRYREISTDFNSLKQQLVTPESPTRVPAPPLVSAEGEGIIPAAPYRLPLSYPPMPPMGSGYGATGGGVGSPLRQHASAPPAWWWNSEGARPSPRRRSSPDSRGSRERRHNHKERDRDNSRYKEKSSKPSAARSEHRHRKR